MKWCDWQFWICSGTLLNKIGGSGWGDYVGYIIYRENAIIISKHKNIRVYSLRVLLSECRPCKHYLEKESIPAAL